MDKGFNKRQSNLLGYLFIKPNSTITIPEYSKKHNIVRQTASRDLTQLEKKGVLTKHKDGKNLIYQLNGKKHLKQILEE